MILAPGPLGLKVVDSVRRRLLGISLFGPGRPGALAGVKIAKKTYVLKGAFGFIAYTECSPLKHQDLVLKEFLIFFTERTRPFDKPYMANMFSNLSWGLF